MIDEYLKERTDSGEVLQNDTPLIRDLSALNTKKVKPLTIYNIKYIVHEIVEKSGVRDTFQFTGEVHLSHRFRKFFVTQCESSSMKSVHVSMLTGHDIGIKKHYYLPKESDLLEVYMTHAADALTIDPTKRPQQENQDLKPKQAEEIVQLQQQVQEMEGQRSEGAHAKTGRMAIVSR